MADQRNIIISTLSDLKNGLPPRRLSEKMYPKGIVFVHVPKCAGSSIEQGLRRHYRLSRAMVHPGLSFNAAQAEFVANAQNEGQKTPNVNDETRNAVLMRASEMRREVLQYHLAAGYKCITGHAPLANKTVEAWAGRYDFVTVLREPLARYHSHLSFNSSALAGHGFVEEESSAFLNRPRAKIMGALYVKYFSGLPMDANFHSQAAIDAAKENLERFAAVGFLENLNLFADNVSKLTKKQISVGHINKTVTNTPVERSKKMSKEIAELCAPDLEIYAWAQAKFGSKVPTP